MVAEANEEHHVVKFLIKELRKMKGSVEGYKAKFTVLSELVKHHVEEGRGDVSTSGESRCRLGQTRAGSHEEIKDACETRSEPTTSCLDTHDPG